jgi:hypothetical protein
MRKFIFMLMAMLIMTSAGFAQTKDSKKTTAATAKTITTPAAATNKTKKDGTPDKRFKENKAAAKPAGPLKKDGTPDMRYKANQTAAKK